MISRGIQYMLVATVCFAVMNVFVKLVKHIPPVEIVFFRSLVSFFMSFIMLKAQNVNIWGNRKTILIARGLVGAILLLAAGLLEIFGGSNVVSDCPLTFSQNRGDARQRNARQNEEDNQ